MQKQPTVPRKMKKINLKIESIFLLAVSRAPALIPMQKAAAPAWFPTLKSCCAGPVSDIKKLLHRSGIACDLNTALFNTEVEAMMA